MLYYKHLAVLAGHVEYEHTWTPRTPVARASGATRPSSGRASRLVGRWDGRHHELAGGLRDSSAQVSARRPDLVISHVDIERYFPARNSCSLLTAWSIVNVAGAWYRLPKNSSNPWFVGRSWLRSPRWFLPN